MANMMAEGFAWHAAQQKAHCSREVTYTRGVNSVTLSVVDGAREFEADDGSGVIDRYEVRDYIFPAADLIIASLLTVPARGDTITDGTHTYTVDMPDGIEGYQEDGAGARLVVDTWERRAG